MGSLMVRHDWATSLSLFPFAHWRRKWQPTPVFLPGESQGRGAWWAAVYGVAQSRTRLKQLSSSNRSRIEAPTAAGMCVQSHSRDSNSNLSCFVMWVHSRHCITVLPTVTKSVLVRNRLIDPGTRSVVATGQWEGWIKSLGLGDANYYI